MPKQHSRIPRSPDLSAPALVQPLDPILRRELVIEVTGLSRSALYREINAGRFPGPVRLTDSAVGWRQSEVVHWIRSRPGTAELGSAVTPSRHPEDETPASGGAE